MISSDRCGNILLKMKSIVLISNFNNWIETFQIQSKTDDKTLESFGEYSCHSDYAMYVYRG